MPGAGAQEMNRAEAGHLGADDGDGDREVAGHGIVVQELCGVSGESAG